MEFVEKNCRDRYNEKLSNFGSILSKRVIDLDKSEIKSTGYVVDTLESVFWLFFNTDSYDKCVLEAVNLGGDTDTIAAIAGGLCGVYYGFDNIPDRWIQNVTRKQEIKELIDVFILHLSDSSFS